MAFSSVLEMFLQYIDYNYLLGGLFVLSVGYYIGKAFRSDKKMGLAALLAILFSFVTVFNPFLFRQLALIVENGASYYRFIWCIPLVALSAGFLAEVVHLSYRTAAKAISSSRSAKIISARDPSKPSSPAAAASTITALLLSAAIIFSGTTYLSKENLTIPENKFAISRAALDISQFIQDDPEHTPGDVILAPTEIMMELQAYDISIVPALPRTEYIHYQQEDSVYKPLLSLILEGPENTWHHFENVRYNVNSLDVEYIVTLTLFDLDTYMEFLDYPVYNRTGDYTLYKRRD